MGTGDRKHRAQLTLVRQDIFARKCMYEKLIKCTAKTGFKIQRYISRTHEMKDGMLSKNKGYLFSLLPKIYQLPKYIHDVCQKNTSSPKFGGQLPWAEEVGKWGARRGLAPSNTSGEPSMLLAPPGKCLISLQFRHSPWP